MRGILCVFNAGRSNLQIAPFWNIKWTEITWTRLKLCTYSSSSWCTDGPRAVMDSRDKITIMKSVKMEEGSYKALNVITHLFFCCRFSHCVPYRGSSSLECLHFYRSACQTPLSFPTHSSAIIINCPQTHLLMFVWMCASVSLLSEKIRPHQRVSSGDASRILSLLLGSCIYWLLRSPHLYDQPLLPPILRLWHTHTHTRS